MAPAADLLADAVVLRDDFSVLPLPILLIVTFILMPVLPGMSVRLLVPEFLATNVDVALYADSILVTRNSPLEYLPTPYHGRILGLLVARLVYYIAVRQHERSP